MTPIALMKAVTARLDGMVNTTVMENEFTATPADRQYVWLQMLAGRVFSQTLAHRRESLNPGLIVHYVGTTEAECLDALTQGRALLCGWDPDPESLATWVLDETEDEASVLAERVGGSVVRYSCSPTYRLTTER